MPFSRYQIRNEFSLADPELYKSADKDDPEALLEGVAMAGLVGVLRQLGDLAEFAAEIFHGLHEEVMATAARGHGLLTRVQQVESDLPLIERAFLSQTGHSAFFSSPGISWHPNLQTEQNLITKGDLPRFVMDSYEECRGPPRLFLLDKFDVAGAGACLKRYTDPSFYKVEVSSYDMMNAEAQRDKKIRKTKKKGSRLKNGDTPEVFQPSHVKLHQLLLEERVQNGASEPARRVKIKKREIKFPFDTETGKGYMEKLLSSPEDKLVHEVKMVNSPLRLPTKSSEEQELETLEDKMVNPPLDDIEEKHISVVEDNKEDGVEDVSHSDDVASETENYMDALATMESEVETDVEFRAANSDPIIKQETFSDSNLEKLQKSQDSVSQSASDDESSPMKSKVTTFSYSDSDSTTSANNMSPHVNSPHAFASKEIPFRPRVLPTQVSDNCIEVSDNADLLVDQETIFKESNSKESDLSEMSSNNCVDVNILTKVTDVTASENNPTKGEIEIDPEDVIASVIDESNSSSTLVNSHVKEQFLGPCLDQDDLCENGVLESKSDPAEATVSYSNEDETELKDKDTVSLDPESENADVSDCDPDDGENGDNNHFIPKDEEELNERIPESFSFETKDSSSVPVTNDFESNEIKDLSADESAEKESVEESVISPELYSTPAYYDHSHVQYINNSHSNGNENDINEPSAEVIESDDKKELIEESDISPGLKSIPSASNDHSNTQILDDICDMDGNDDDKPEKESLVSGEMKESGVKSAIYSELDSIPSVYNVHPSIQFLDSIHKNANENDIDNPEKESIESGQKESGEEPVISLESDSVLSAYDIHNNGNESDGDNLKKESIESGEKRESCEEPVISPESDSIPSAHHDQPNMFLDTIQNNVNENDNDKPSMESIELDGKNESSEEPVTVPESDSIPSAHHDQPNIQFLDSIHNSGNENDNDNPSTELIESGEKRESSEEPVTFLESDFIPSALYDRSNVHDENAFVTEKTDQNGLQNVPQDINFQSSTKFYDYRPDLAESAEAQESKSSHVDEDSQLNSHLSQDLVEPSVVGLLLPKLAPINMEEMPPLPPLPPMQWRMGRSQNPSSVSIPGGGQADISHFLSVFPQIEAHSSSNQNEVSIPGGGQADICHFPPVFPQIEAHSSSNQNEVSIPGGVQADISHFPPVFPQIEVHSSSNQYEVSKNEKSEHDYEVNRGKNTEELVPQAPIINREESRNDSISEPEIIRLPSTSSLPSGDNGVPNGIRPMKIQRPRTPLIDAVAAHDKNKLRKVAERAMPLFPKEEEKDTFLEQIRAKSFNLKPAVPTRPIIQGPTTNLRVAAILEKANAIRQAFAGSDDDDDDDSWSDS